MESFGGRQLSRQFSQSQTTPRNLMAYTNFFRQNSIPETGWLEIRLDHNENSWVKYWVEFDNAASTLSYSQSVDGPPIATIAMNSVVSFRTDTPTSLVITTTEHNMHLRANNVEDLKGWLFCFQKSVALVLSQLIDVASSSSIQTSGRGVNIRRSYNSGSSGSLYSSDDGNDDSTVSSVSARSKSSTTPSEGLSAGFSTVGGTALHRHDTKSFYPSDLRNLNELGFRAFTDEDIEGIVGVNSTSEESGVVRWERSRSTLNLSRLGPMDGPGMGSRTSHSILTSHSFGSVRGGASGMGLEIPRKNGSGDASSRPPTAPGVSMSPAIPIFMGLPQGTTTEVKLAGSYVESYHEGQHLEDRFGRGQDLRARSSSDHASEDSVAETSDGEDDGVIFDLEEMTSGAKSSPGAGGTTSTRSPSKVGREDAARGRSRENSCSTSSARFSPSSLLQGANIRPSWEVGSCSKLGPRSSNEDRLVALSDLREVPVIAADVTFPSPLDTDAKSSQHGFFAVYDGHCGQHASSFLQEKLHEKIARHDNFFTGLEHAIVETCVAADKEFLTLCHEKRIFCGTTALGAFVRGDQLTVFNIGDCQAVLCSNGVAVPMSNAHQPGRPDESERIVKAGGWITEERELYMGRLHRMDLSDPVVRDKAQQVNWVTIHRVCGELAVSRSIGDPDYKGFIPGEVVNAGFLWPEGHSQIFHADLVIPVPEIVNATITPTDEFLLLASDGLWDVVSGSEAVARARLLFSQNKTPNEAAEELCDLALKLGSSDNVSIVIVKFSC